MAGSTSHFFWREEVLVSGGGQIPFRFQLLGHLSASEMIVVSLLYKFRRHVSDEFCPVVFGGVWLEFALLHLVFLQSFSLQVEFFLVLAPPHRVALENTNLSGDLAVGVSAAILDLRCVWFSRNKELVLLGSTFLFLGSPALFFFARFGIDVQFFESVRPRLIVRAVDIRTLLVYCRLRVLPNKAPDFFFFLIHF